MKRTVFPVPVPPFVGVVVGLRRRFLGRYHRSLSDWSTDYDPAYLEPDGSVLVWLVTRGLTNTPVEVLEEDLKPASYQEWPPKLPWRHQNEPPELSEGLRDYLREVARRMPRDARGRFQRLPSPSATTNSAK